MHKFRIHSYLLFNPNVQKNPNLSEHILEKNIHQSKVIIAGDFNQSTNTSSDYKRINGRKLEPSTIENKAKKAEYFNQLVKNCNLFLKKETIFSLLRKTKDENYLRKIYLIFYTKYFENYRNQFSTFETPFNTDHKAIKQVFNLSLNSEKPKNLNNNLFQIPDQYFNDPLFTITLSNNLKEAKKEWVSWQDKLQFMINTSIETAKEHKRLIKTNLQKKRILGKS